MDPTHNHDNIEIEQGVEAIELEDQQDFNDQQAIEDMEAEQLQEQLQEHSQRMIQKLNNQQPIAVEQKPTEVRNPICPYMMFVKSWKQNHPQQKFNVSLLGQIWKAMSVSQKQPYEVEYRQRKQQYDEYQAILQINNPNQHSDLPNGSKNIFPLQRIRAIMKQDSYYSAKVEATTAMAKATEYFAQYFLEEIKKLSEGKNRIDAKLMYDCINNNRSLSFLECLIQEYNKESNETGKQKKNKPEIRLQFEDSPKKVENKQKFQAVQSNRSEAKPKAKPQTKPAVSGQMSLDSFVSKQR